jgi:hypothetical protein
VSDALELAIDLKIPGHRDVTPAASLLKPTDRLVVPAAAGGRLPADRYVETAMALIVPRIGDAPAAAPGLDADHAVIDFVLEVDNPLGAGAT